MDDLQALQRIGPKRLGETAEASNRECASLGEKANDTSRSYQGTTRQTLPSEAEGCSRKTADSADDDVEEELLMKGSRKQTLQLH